MTYREVLGKGKKTGAKEQKTAVVRRRFIFQSRKARDTHTHTHKSNDMCTNLRQSHHIMGFLNKAAVADWWAEKGQRLLLGKKNWRVS